VVCQGLIVGIAEDYHQRNDSAICLLRDPGQLMNSSITLPLEASSFAEPADALSLR